MIAGTSAPAIDSKAPTPVSEEANSKNIMDTVPLSSPKTSLDLGGAEKIAADGPDLEGGACNAQVVPGSTDRVTESDSTLAPPEHNP